ncbi:MAG: hypothetical protein LWW94_11085 [Candidatus Desulfofervidaceae bacterium]|nr:hypothetical protein [Candidatus Desulfofervidaceae bacterium]
MEEKINKLMEKLQKRIINTKELEELKNILEKKMEEHEEQGECEQILSVSILLRMVDNFLEKRWNKRKT